MKLSPRNQLIAVVVGLAVVLLAVVGLLVWPQYQKQKALDAQVALAEQQLATSQSLLAQRQQIKDQAALTDAQWLRLATLVPENPDLPALIIELQDAAFASGVQLTGVVPAEPTVSADLAYVAFPLEIRIVGTWADTVDYLKTVNKLNRGIRENSFTASVAPPNTGDPVLPNYSQSTVIQLQAYTIPAFASTVPTAAPAPATP